MTTLDLDRMTEYVGRSESVSDTITPKLVTLFNATFAPHVAPALPAETSLGIHCASPRRLHRPVNSVMMAIP